jgi:TonB-linked SusC/RagA family outer membrane protein
MISGSLTENGNIQLHKGSFGDGSLRFSLNTGTADDKFNLNLSGSFLSSKSDMVPFDFSQSLAFEAPNAPPSFLPNGSVDWIGAATDPNGPGTAANVNRTYNNVTNNLFANGTLVYKPVSGLTLRAIFGYNDLTSKEMIGYPTTTMAPTFTAAAQQTHSTFHHYDIRTLSVSPYAEYDRTLWKKGDLSVKAGGEIDDQLTYWDDISGVGFPSDALLSNPATGTTVTSTYSQTPFRRLGFYGIVKYVWDQKYIIDLNGRRDGSTRFGPANRFGNFGSIAAAWIFSEEKLIKEYVPFLSFGKLRASTGVLGGDQISDYAYLSTYSAMTGTYDGKLGLSPSSPANPDLKWEKNREKEIGLELGFFNDRVYVEGNYYRNAISNQLVTRPVSTVTGFGGYVLNSDAVIRSSGWEMSLSTTNIKTKNFSWTSRFNISIPTSKLIKAPGIANQNVNYIVGKPLTGVLLYKYAGVDPATGLFSFTNAKGVTQDYITGLTQTDKTEFIDLAPKYYGGFQNSFTYKQFSLDVFFSFTNRRGPNALSQAGYLFGYFDINGTTDWLRRWQKPGDKTDIPKVSTNLIDGYLRLNNYYKNSTGAYTSATYARLQNVSFRYHFDPNLLRKMHVKDLTIYLQGQNLLTISRFGRLDPENLNAAVIPPLRVFTGGINLTL